MKNTEVLTLTACHWKILMKCVTKTCIINLFHLNGNRCCASESDMLQMGTYSQMDTRSHHDEETTYEMEVLNYTFQLFI